MPNAETQSFIQALKRYEQDGDVQPLAGLFAPDAKLHSYTRDARGADAATFWREYREAFGNVRSEFTRVTDSGDAAVLEWVSDGTLPGGDPIRYEGVSLLDFRDGKVARFRTYYDSAAFVQPATPAAR